MVTGLIYVVFASAQLQPWGISKKSNLKYNTNNNNNNKKNVYSVTNFNDDDNEDKLH